MACNEAGVPVRFVEALVVLPGWTVKYPKGAAERIRDPRNMVAFLEKQESQSNPDEIERIATLLEKWCRGLTFDRDGSE